MENEDYFEDIEYGQDRNFQIENNDALPEKKPFIKPKEGVVFIVDCHSYDDQPFDKEITEAMIRMMKQTPIFYPKDRFGLIFYGSQNSTKSLAEGIQNVHILQNATIKLLEEYRKFFDNIKPSKKLIPLINAFQATHKIFQAANIINQPRIVFVVPPQFFTHHQITPEINAYIINNPPEPIFFSSKYQIPQFPFKCFPLNRLERVCISFHKSFGYYYDFIPYEGCRIKVIINNISTSISASTLGNVLVEKEGWRVVIGKIRKEEMPDGEKRELTAHNEGDVWDYSFGSKKITFTEEEYQKLHTIEEKYRNSIIVKGKISQDFLQSTTSSASFIRPIEDSGWYDALYQTLLKEKQALRCDFFSRSQVKDVAIVPVKSTSEFIPSGLYMIYLPYIDDVLTPLLSEPEFNIHSTNCNVSQNQSMKSLISKCTTSNIDFMALKNPVMEERINAIIEAMKIDLQQESTLENNEVPIDDIQNVKDHFILPTKRIRPTKPKEQLKIDDDMMLDIYHGICSGKGNTYNASLLKKFLIQSNVSVTSRDKKSDLVEKANKLVKGIQQQLGEKEENDNNSTVQEKKDI
ncbi:hypothetical protein ENUP19_0042G0039 [Entamoeba nuttalli]|uniref:Ku domain-containing protein n=2 Tax=Entamoeba nuttalli TaxID=412467 RepID=K2GCK1_ENTNP|nr:hypothetical protein ENU1_096270 [Entamoeba nuttalli P19]EKE40266.1 hypothetical protein ENU1_096270 [Entamoeba nuttalli P19]|eukprot:XP_008857401.1 hypothetical protein ENU1_096270 [Entamoeba nuttalli P19]